MTMETANKMPGIGLDKSRKRWAVHVTDMMGERHTVGRFKEYADAEIALAKAQSIYFRCGCVARS